MKMSDLKQSKYIQKEDVGRGILVTIARVEMENVARQGEAQKLRGILYFNEAQYKPLVLNMTNSSLIAQIANTGADDDVQRCWPGLQIVLYNDPTVMNGGKMVGGIRVRQPQFKPGVVQPGVGPQQAPAQDRAPAPIPAQDSDLPF